MMEIILFLILYITAELTSIYVISDICFNLKLRVGWAKLFGVIFIVLTISYVFFVLNGMFKDVPDWLMALLCMVSSSWVSITVIGLVEGFYDSLTNKYWKQFEKFSNRYGDEINAWKQTNDTDEKM